MPRAPAKPVPSALECFHPLAARILADPDLAVLLKPFMRGPMSLKCAADELGIPIQTLHYRAKQMLQAGLLQLECEAARRGRAVKYYRATARAFQVPLELVPNHSLERLENYASWKRLLEEGVAQASKARPRSDTLSVHLDGDGNLIWDAPADECLRPPELADDEPAVLDFWSASLRLSRREAKMFQKELWLLYEKYAHRKGSERYVLHLGLAPHPGGKGGKRKDEGL